MKLCKFLFVVVAVVGLSTNAISAETVSTAGRMATAVGRVVIGDGDSIPLKVSDGTIKLPAADTATGCIPASIVDIFHISNDRDDVIGGASVLVGAAGVRRLQSETAARVINNSIDGGGVLNVNGTLSKRSSMSQWGTVGSSSSVSSGSCSH